VTRELRAVLRGVLSAAAVWLAVTTLLDVSYNTTLAAVAVVFLLGVFWQSEASA